MPDTHGLPHTGDQGLTPRLERWSRVHATAILAGLAASALYGHSAPLALAGSLSLARLLFERCGAYTPQGRFGIANRVTALRAVMLLGVAALGPTLPGAVVASLAITVLGLDALDGWLARRTRSCSDFGMTFDVETDALLVAVLCLRLWQVEGFGPWVLTSAALRYFYVLSFMLHRRQERQRRTRFGRFAFVALVLGLAVALIQPETFGPRAAMLGTALVCVSFARSFRALWRASEFAA